MKNTDRRKFLQSFSAGMTGTLLLFAYPSNIEQTTEIPSSFYENRQADS